MTDRGMLQSLTEIVNTSICPCSSISFYFMYFNALLLGTYTLELLCLLGKLNFLSICHVSLLSLIFFPYYEV